MGADKEKLRKIPKVDEIMQSEALLSVMDGAARELVLTAVRETVEHVRSEILAGENPQTDAEAVAQAAKARFFELDRRNLRRVINGTGIILHTNLGRARMHPKAAAAAAAAAESYSNLEYDLEAGKRGSRHDHVAALAARVTGAEDAMVVNNNAAAVALCLSALAKEKEVIVSRGELVEIGGAFRVPEIMEQSGAFLREVGTTNKTKITDYQSAIGEYTGALLKVHTSNYRIVGFTEEAALADMVRLGHEAGLPVLYDLGSGLLADLSAYGVEEPTVQAGLAAGADVVMFSGDKLLGGPQAGIVVGKKEYIDKMKKHPMARMVRSDKMTLAALEETLRVYLDMERAKREIPVLDMITADLDALTQKAEKLKTAIGAALAAAGAGQRCEAALLKENSQIGGGSAPMLDLPTCVVALTPAGVTVDALEEKLRRRELPLIGRISRDHLLLDVRTIREEEFAAAAQAVAESV